MALTRSLLKGMGLTDEQVGAIIDAHTETTDALKEQRDEFKKKATKLDTVQKELDEIKVNSAGEKEWKEKFDAERKAFDEFKAELKAKDARAAKVDAYKGLLKDAKISEKLIELVVKANSADIDKLELDDEGNIKTAEELKKSIAEDYKDYITSSDTEGAGTNNPPGNDGAGKDKDLGALSMDEYLKARGFS